MAENNPVQWPPARNRRLKAIFDKVTDEFGPPDVDFRAGPRSFMVHKKVLEKHSLVLKAKLSDVWQTSGDVLQLDEEFVKPEVVEELLVSLYFMHEGEKPKCSIKNAYSLCIAADYLMISEIVTSCCVKLRQNITPDNVFDLFALSKLLNLHDLQQACENSIVNKPNDFLLSPQVVKWTAEDLKMFFEKLFKVEDSIDVRGTILSSLTIWTRDLSEDRSRELMNLLKCIPPQAVPSNDLFRFVQTTPTNYNHKLPAAVAHEGRIYVLSQTGFEAYSLEHDRWIHLPRPDVCLKPSLVSIAGRLYLISDSVCCFKYRLIYEFDVITQEWTELPDPPEVNHTDSSVVIEQ